MNTADMKAALVRIAKQDYCDVSGDPTKWAPIIAYLALGGRYDVNGRELDDIDDLAKQPCESVDVTQGLSHPRRARCTLR